ncbi:MAG: hypothetical protein M0Z75_03755 [Nitrospiraceae bacterium]|nr:hypothetical protein [Nitrospiraceae bacterium]
MQNKTEEWLMESKYMSWLEKSGAPLLRGAGTLWTLYHGALVPASPFPEYPEVDSGQADSLLKASGAWLIRYSTAPCDYETSWWYVVCSNHDPTDIRAKTRSEIKRGRRECIVHEVDPGWLADNGYPCYCAAVARYRDLKPVAEGVFKKIILNTRDGPFCYWTVFHEGHLAGYCQCIIEGMHVSTNVAKYDPLYLRHRSAYALIDTLIQTYVVGKGMTLCNGNRSIAHNTNYQDFLIKLGFRKQFCRLNVVYNPLLKLAVDALYPIRSMLAGLPGLRIINRARALLFQEEIRRTASANGR